MQTVIKSYKNYNLDVKNPFVKMMALGFFKQIPGYINKVSFENLTVVFTCSPVNLVKVVEFAKLHYNLSAVLDFYGLDKLYTAERFRLRIVFKPKVNFNFPYFISFDIFLSELTFYNSLSTLFNSIIWLEREIYDAFGLVPEGNIDMRRLLADYGFKGYPFRKDFPLSGFVEAWYDDSRQRIEFRPIRLMQEFRFFDTLSPWIAGF